MLFTPSSYTLHETYSGQGVQWGFIGVSLLGGIYIVGGGRDHSAEESGALLRPGKDLARGKFLPSWLAVASCTLTCFLMLPCWVDQVLKDALDERQGALGGCLVLAGIYLPPLLLGNRRRRRS